MGDQAQVVAGEVFERVDVSTVDEAGGLPSTRQEVRVIGIGGLCVVPHFVGEVVAICNWVDQIGALLNDTVFSVRCGFT